MFAPRGASERVPRACPWGSTGQAVRGFAILLYSYLVVFFLCAFVTTILTRSALDLRYAERSIGVNQAFWAAEGVLEDSINYLRDAQLPTLAVGQCTSASTPFRSVTLASATGRADLCLVTAPSYSGSTQTISYQLRATGTSGGTTQVVQAMLSYSAQTTQFLHVAYGTQISLSDASTGGLNSSVQPVLFSNTTSHGDLATPGNTPYLHADGTLGPRIVMINSSRVMGDVYIGAGGNFSTLVRISPSSILGGTEKYLDGTTSLPLIQVPADAIDLMSIVPHDLWSNIKQDTCLAPGTYVTSLLKIAKVQVCTTGPVDIYVTDKLMIYEGQLYGQPQGSPAFGGLYSPKDLRIFFKGDNQILHGTTGELGQNDKISLVAGVIYAPTADITISGDFTLAGSLLAGGKVSNLGLITAVDGALVNSRPVMLYDEVLTLQRFRIGPATVSVSSWTN